MILMAALFVLLVFISFIRTISILESYLMLFAFIQQRMFLNHDGRFG